jgi:Flp pilus assembly protein TadD
VDLEGILNELGGRFADVEPLVEGRTGASYRARDVEGGRHGVLKILHPEQGQGSEGMRLKRELARQLDMNHPNLALPSATGEAGGRLWLFREYVEGESLRQRLSKDGPLPVTEALCIVAQIASGLDELHRGGMLHRDIQPGHVILSGDAEELPRAVIIDASLAAPIGGSAAVDLRGTPEYLSPEQARGKLVSFRSDLYSLGCLLYELLTGAPPFTGDAAAVIERHAKEPPPAPPDHLPDGGKLVTSLLSKEPRERPFSAQQVRRTLDAFLPEALRSRRGSAAGPAVPGAPARAVPAPPKQTLMGVPPMTRAAGEAAGSPAAKADGASPEPDPSADWGDDHTEQIDALDLLEVANAAPAKASVPPPTPGPGKAASTPPPPPPAARSVPPPLASATAASSPSGGPDPQVPLPQVPPVPTEVRAQDGWAREGGQESRRLLGVGLASFLMGALVSGLAVYGFMADDDSGPAMAEGPGGTALPPPADVPPPPTSREGAGSPGDDAVGSDDGLEGEPEPEGDGALEVDAGLQEASEEEPEEPEEPEPTVDEEPDRDDSAARAAAERRRRLQAQRRAQQARRKQQAQKSPAPSGKSPFDQAQEDAREAFRKRDYAGAARAYERATKIRSNHAGSYAGLGAARLAKGDARGAVAAYEKAARLQPGHGGFQVALGRARQTAGDRAGAKRAYQRALAIDPNNRAAKAALENLR